jgi:predicted PurR-regulated permease PerM
MTEHNYTPKDRHPHNDRPPTRSAKRTFLQRVALVDGIGVIFVLALAGIWFAANALLLVFACILFAILLYELSSMLQSRLRVSHRTALGLVVLLMLAVVGTGGWLMAPQISEQASKLVETVPESLQRLRAVLERHKFLKSLLTDLPSTEEIRTHLASLVPNAGLFFSGVLGALGNVVIVVFVGIYFAAQPALYIDGIVTLVPPRKRKRAREVLNEIGRTLAKWLLGKSISMVVVGIATALGLSLLGVPLALILGIIAGLLDFIPYLGPLMAGVPAVLIAFSVSPFLALYTALLLLAVQLVEGYLLQPLVEAKAVSLPPALTIVMQLMFGALFGLAGVALATPMTAVLAVLVTMLYVQDVLGDPVKTPAEL